MPRRGVARTLAEDVRDGLGAARKYLPSKYFYDARGSELFDRICATPEYYPTRTENRLLERHAGEIIARATPASILELGAGSAAKTEHLFQACEYAGRRCVYQPLDVDGQMIRQAGARLVGRFRWLEVDGWAGDFVDAAGRLPPGARPRMIVFLGGTLGNFDEHQAPALLRALRSSLSGGDWFLLGVDRVKDPAVLDAAYNDAAGVTAAFNLNILRVINRKLGADFDPAGFAHHAFFDIDKRRIEMHLRSLRKQRATIPGVLPEVHFGVGESILTEISRKFTGPDLEALLRGAGLSPVVHYEAPGAYYSLLLCRPAVSPA